MFSVLFKRFYLLFRLIFNCFCFSKAFPKGKYINWTCSTVLLWSKDNISSPVKYLYLSILPSNAFLLISNYSFSYLILLSTVLISFYIHSKRFFLKRKGLFDARVVLTTKQEWFGSTFFVNIYEVFIVNIGWMINVICWISHFLEFSK